MKILVRLFFAFAALCACGCVSVRTVKVDAIASVRPVAARAFAVVPADPKLSPEDLRFQEAAHTVALALEAHGYTLAQDATHADVIIAIDASISAPQDVSVTRLEPMFPDAGGFYCMARVPVRNRNGSVCFARTAVWTPSMYPRSYGMEQSTFTNTLYEKRLSLTAYANATGDTQDLPQLWSVVVMCRDESGDLRTCLPTLAVAAARYVESDTKGQRVIRLKADDPAVIRVTAPAASVK
jgi:hypothetical protein